MKKGLISQKLKNLHFINLGQITKRLQSFDVREHFFENGIHCINGVDYHSNLEFWAVCDDLMTGFPTLVYNINGERALIDMLMDHTQSHTLI